MSASYDPFRKVFVVTFVDPLYQARMYTMPAPGSGQSGNVLSLIPSGSVWQAPALACGESGGECVMVAMGRLLSSADPPLWWSRGSINASGTWTPLVTQFQSSLPQTQEPRVAFQGSTSRYTMTYMGRDGNSVLYNHITFPSSAWPTPSSSLAVYPSNAIAPPVIGMDEGVSPSLMKHAVIGTVLYGP